MNGTAVNKEKTMVNKKFWSGMLAMALLFGILVIGCDNGTGGSTNFDDEEIIFTSGDYTLRIYKSGGRAVYVPETNDRYELKNSSGKIISSGVITAFVDGIYTFSPASGKPDFTGTLSSNGAAFQITSTITLDDGSQLSGLSLSDTEDTGNEIPVYTSYKAAAEAGYLFHNGQIDDINLPIREGLDAFTALMKTLDYTQIKIDSDLPISWNFQFDFSVIKDELDMQANEYYKWDIQYNDHRVLAQYYYTTKGGYFYYYTLVNEILLFPEINGGNYSGGKIKHVDYEYGVSDYSVINTALSGDSYDEISINGNAPVDNLGLLQAVRIIEAVKTARGIKLQAGDYILWRITYNDSIWIMKFFIESVNADGSPDFWHWVW
jgi:hypothetical protein